MWFLKILLCLLTLLMQNTNAVYKKPTILVSLLVRNKAHTLPYFLSNLERLNYPKDRISLWIRSDHNSDESLEILRLWISSVKNQYHSIETEFVDDGATYYQERGPAHWTTDRFVHIINLREMALKFARKIWADYLLTIDCDVFIVNPETLNHLISKNFTVTAPMLRSEGMYSNFWYGMTEDYYYKRTEEYKPVLYREKTGCFQVPMVHSCVLIDLRKVESEYLTYVPNKVKDFNGPHDDIITFAISANTSGVPLNLCNEERFGFVTVPLEQNDQLSLDYEQVVNVKLEVLNEQMPLYVSDLLKPYERKQPNKDSLGFDKIFMINLMRRPERRRRMQACFDELGLEVAVVDAVDGKTLNETFLEGIKFMPEFSDPYHKRFEQRYLETYPERAQPHRTIFAKLHRHLTENGSFEHRRMHYGIKVAAQTEQEILERIVANEYETVLVLEDDIRFEPFFRAKVHNLMNEVQNIPDWDLVYFGRKRLEESDEPWVEGSNLLVKAGYSYWTLGYALSLRGAKKLLDGDPLSRLVPVDEYLPILFDKHPQDSWKGYFPQRNLIAFSAAPLLLYPTHYTGDSGYISDTEDSVIIPDTMTSTREDL